MVEKFKVTDLGLRPVDWNPKLISDFIFDFRGGAPLKPTDFKKNGFKVLPKVGVIRGGSLLIEKDKQQYCSEDYANLHNSNVVDNTYTIVVLRDLVPSGPNIGLMVRIVKSDSFLLAQGVYGFRLKEGVSSDFLIHVSNTDDYRKVMRNIMVGSTQVHITNGAFKKVLIPLPPTLTEQTAIATALNDADALINNLEKLIAKKRNIKTGAMQVLLKPKDGWKWTTVDKLGKPFGGLSGKAKADFKDGNCPYIPFMNVMSNPIIDTTYFDYVKISPTESQHKAEKGDLFFNGSSETPEEVGMCSVLLEDIPNLYLNSFCFGFRLYKEEKNDGLFLAYFFRSSYGRKMFYILAQGATRHNLSKSNFLKVEIQIPEPFEQIKIATILSDMDNEIQQLEKKLEKFKMLKQGMMQVLLTGKIRLV